jgi:hypothetical protein
VGRVAVFKYHSGISHVALVTELSINGFWVREANYRAGKIGVRFVPYNDYSIVSFFEPSITQTGGNLAQLPVAQSQEVASSNKTNTVSSTPFYLLNI